MEKVALTSRRPGQPEGSQPCRCRVSPPSRADPGLIPLSSFWVKQVVDGIERSQCTVPQSNYWPLVWDLHLNPFQKCEGHLLLDLITGFLEGISVLACWSEKHISCPHKAHCHGEADRKAAGLWACRAGQDVNGGSEPWKRGGCGQRGEKQGRENRTAR